MIASIKDTLSLNDQSRMPQHGFGCFLVEPDRMNQIIGWALEAGYRYFDTATRYENEASLGNALRVSGTPREELYLVSKIWPTSYTDPEKAIEYSLRQLNLDYIDSYYLHWPGTDEYLRHKAWEALLQYREKGLIGSVGVSNFQRPHLERLMSSFGVVPVANQIELHPWYPQTQLSDWCRRQGMQVTAWGPIFRGKIDQVPLVREIGSRYGKSSVQVTLRWHLQKGNVVIPKSSQQKRILDNAAIYGFSLTPQEMAQIDALESGRHFGADPNLYNGEDFIPATD